MKNLFGIPLCSLLLVMLSASVSAGATATPASAPASTTTSSPSPANAPRILQRLPIARVWSGHPVGFALLTDAPGNRQYVAFYDADRHMTVASRRLDSDTWAQKILPSQIGWDSHNYITLALDRDNHLHVVGNLHATPLVYFRTETPGDVATLEPVSRMTGKREQRMTYPRFIKDHDGSLVFSWRDGGSGNGSTWFNRYDEKSREWTPLFDTPLFDGQGEMNAYPQEPTPGPDGFWHITWVWRDSHLAETNHDLGYARSRDLRSWETVSGQPVALPITLQTPGVILDPIPVNGGIINGSGRIGFDNRNRVIVAYHKFDDNGATQLYLARPGEAGTWDIRQVTRWTYRWEPRGRGSIGFEIRHTGVNHDPNLGLYISINHIRHGNGVWPIDPDTLRLGRRIPNEQVPGRNPSELGRATPPFTLRTATDTGIAPAGLRYLLRWEALPVNRDLPHEGPLPEPSTLELVVIQTHSN